MNRKKIVIIGILVVAAVVAGFLAFKKSGNDNVITKKDPVTGLSIYTNLDWGFSVAYPGDYWEGPVEKPETDLKADNSSINAVFTSTSTAEAILIIGKLGDTETRNDYAAKLDSYNVVTVGGLPALRYEYIAPIDEKATAYAKTVMFVFNELPKGSVTVAYQRFFNTEFDAKKADSVKIADFVSRFTFNQTTESSAAASK